jgi:hypothetical protein
MEKPGMGRRYSGIGPGLLSIFLFIAVLCFGQDDGIFPDPDYYLDYPENDPLPDSENSEYAEDLRVLLETSPSAPAAQSEWTVSILVDYPDPSEVSVLIPELPPSLVLDRIRTAARFVQGNGISGAQGRWTAVDLFFISSWGGQVSLAPFEVRVPGRRGFSPPLTAYIRDESRNEGASSLRAVWEAFPSSLRVGQSAELRLRLSPLNIRNGASVSFQLEAPVNAILEDLGSETLRGGDIIIRFRIIPLEGPSISLKAARLSFGGASLAVPGREIRVMPAILDVQLADAASAGLPRLAGPAVSADTPESHPEAAFSSGPPAFPDDPGGVFPPFRGAYGRTIAEAREYWEQGWYAEALTVLRIGERELTTGPVLAQLRRSAETVLGIGFTEDETWQPRRLFLALVVGALMVFLFTIIRARVARDRNSTVTSGVSWGYKVISIIALFIMGAGLFGYFGGSGRMLAGIKPVQGSTSFHLAGVLRGGNAYRVPEEGGAPAYLFQEGEPVRIRSTADSWAYVESFEGKAGWVPLDRVIPY